MNLKRFTGVAVALAAVACWSSPAFAANAFCEMVSHGDKVKKATGHCEYQDNGDRVQITLVNGDAYTLAKTLRDRLPGKAVGTISSLPLFTMPESERHRMVNEAFDLSHPGTPFVQFTYAVVSPVPLVPGAIEGERSPRVWMNIPPARVWAYRRP